MIKHTQNLPLVISRAQHDRLKIRAQNALKNQKKYSKRAQRTGYYQIIYRGNCS